MICYLCVHLGQSGSSAELAKRRLARELCSKKSSNLIRHTSVNLDYLIKSRLNG